MKGKNALIFCVFVLFLTGQFSLDFSRVHASNERYKVSSNDSVPSLQDIIDKAKPGDRIVLAEPKYSGPVVINKRLEILGSENVLLINDKPEPAITIQADGVTVHDINVLQKHAGEESTAVHVQADRVTIRNLKIRTRGFGILLRNAENCILENNNITWDTSQGKSAIGQKGNGIDLFKSNHNRIANNKISNMRDGIYLDNSKSLDIVENMIFGSRYGIHCMYIDGTKIVGNIGEYNMTGAMIMGVRDVLISDNSFAKQKNNANSQGILLYDVQTSIVQKNSIEGNRVGIYLERSSQNKLSHNSIYRNFVGIQFVNAENNIIQNNDFVANVIESEANDSQSNQIEHNFWDSAKVLDTNHDGNSEIKYSINPFYRNLISETPAYQLFFQSPGISFLSGMYEHDQNSWTTDSSPRMKLNQPAIISSTIADKRLLPEKTFLLIIASMLLLISGLTIIYSRGSKT
ncbi:nitrous oxidase accessory protein [Fontibacillus phaseoli]|uniref:Nitrous oxidase accessory protein n=1 Tax=Fontibacillus phaseoli TaxID=1416533 RepID=A0A369BT39_9BACL|nr:NosD domain-containing protein [Fontibacillus phaseoli]RCX23746.1 nitrous oxidase accessory protein [Fontibacillus phaseoli]